MPRLGMDLCTRLALALTCRALFASPWRQSVRAFTLQREIINAGHGDDEDDALGQYPSQELFDVFAPALEELVYALPCHHGSPLSLKRCTRLTTLTLSGDACDSAAWDQPLPATLVELRLGPDYARNSIWWPTAMAVHNDRLVCVDAKGSFTLETCPTCRGYHMD
jgi:hypothetical protein